MTTRLTRAALTVLLAFGAVAATATVGAAWVAGPKPKAIVLTVPSGTVASGQPVKLALSLTPKGGGRPQGGTITFRTGDTVLGTAQATKRITTITTTALPVGETSVWATYSGDRRIAASTSKPKVVTVGAARTTTSLTSAGHVAPGQPAELKATVRSGAVRPTGTVTFTTGDRTARVTLNTHGVATWRPVLGVGTHEITAAYDASSTFAGSTSAQITQIVAPAVATIDQDNNRSSVGTVFVGLVGQTFTAGRTGLLDRVQFGVNDGSSPYQLEIRATSDGLPTDEVLGNASGTTVVGQNDAVLDEPVPVVAGTTYAFVLSSTGPFVGQLTASTYAGGQVTLVDHLDAWSVEPGSEELDLVFATWVR